VTLAAAAMTVAVSAAQPVGTDLALIIDSDSPVAEAEAADRYVRAALAGIGRDAAVVSFQLTARGSRGVPGEGLDVLPLVHFEWTQPQYAGIAVTLAEASDILRNNEAVRDAVIRRACAGQSPRECNGAVHAAAVALVEDTDAATAQKVRSVAEVARTTRARTIILATAGWPTRDARPALDAAARDIRAAGSQLVVWRLRPAIAYTGAIRDAAETLAERLRAPMVRLENDTDIARVRATYTGRTFAGRAERRAATEPSPAMPIEARDSAIVAADAVLRRAAAYVATFEETLASAIWSERYEQEQRTRLKFGASGNRFSTLTGKRTLESELLLLWLPRETTWNAVRDVIAVDGVRRPDGERRARAALNGSSVSVDQLRQLADENGRYNIGQIVRTFNEPTLALVFLDEHYRHRFSFQRGKEDTIDRRRAVTYEFAERTHPTVVQDHGRDVAARGTLWIDSATGQVLQTSLELSDGAAELKGRMTVRYGAHPKFNVLVPVEMRESYTSAAGEEITTVATYSDFRQFETAGRLIIPK
jgi:hypothetical protein